MPACKLSFISCIVVLTLNTNVFCFFFYECIQIVLVPNKEQLLPQPHQTVTKQRWSRTPVTGTLQQSCCFGNGNICRCGSHWLKPIQLLKHADVLINGSSGRQPNSVRLWAWWQGDQLRMGEIWRSGELGMGLVTVRAQGQNSTLFVHEVNCL